LVRKYAKLFLKNTTGYVPLLPNRIVILLMDKLERFTLPTNRTNIKIIKTENGNLYKGEALYTTNIKTGTGGISYPNGSIFEGVWVNNKSTGRGR
jgi:hypothetical protein